MPVQSETPQINTDVLKGLNDARHETTAGRIVEQAKENGDPELLATALDTLLQDAEAEAAEGKLTSKDGKKYTRSELIEGLLGFAEFAREDIEQENLDGLNDSLGVVTSAGKLRSAMDKLIHNQTTGIHLLDALDRLRIREREHQLILKKELGQDATTQLLTNASEFQEPTPENLMNDAEVSATDTTYDYMLDPDYEEPAGTEAAAVRPVETEEEKSLRVLLEHHQKVAQNGQIQNAADNFRDGHK